MNYLMPILYIYDVPQARALLVKYKRAKKNVVVMTVYVSRLQARKLSLIVGI